MAHEPGPESVVREIRRKTRRRYSAEEKIRIVLEGLKGVESIAELCRRQGISPSLYYNCPFTTWCGGPARRQGPAKAGLPGALPPNSGESVSKCGDDPIAPGPNHTGSSNRRHDGAGWTGSLEPELSTRPPGR